MPGPVPLGQGWADSNPTLIESEPAPGTGKRHTSCPRGQCRVTASHTAPSGGGTGRLTQDGRCLQGALLRPHLRDELVHVGQVLRGKPSHVTPRACTAPGPPCAHTEVSGRREHPLACISDCTVLCRIPSPPNGCAWSEAAAGCWELSHCASGLCLPESPALQETRHPAPDTEAEAARDKHRPCHQAMSNSRHCHLYTEHSRSKSQALSQEAACA